MLAGAVAAAASRVGHRAGAKQAVSRSTLIQDVFLPLAKAYVALAEGRPAEAVATATVKALRFAFPLDPMYRALPTLAARRGKP